MESDPIDEPALKILSESQIILMRHARSEENEAMIEATDRNASKEEFIAIATDLKIHDCPISTI